MADLIVYISTVAGNLEMKKHQQRIEMILTSKKIPVEYVDVAASEEDRKKMRDAVGDPKALPPQFVSKQHGYLGNFEAFDNAVEMDELNVFLKSE
ncbi:SH3 domain-binding glutamic acid-rich-like protein 3 [Oscarella lobularis]|uniref:SH3 domain-binding glutamic acid-rich-like protein 3 n=1 Tax=Oscarella lobularis TaxID=121494 RepID=UPI003313F91D